MAMVDMKPTLYRLKENRRIDMIEILFLFAFSTMAVLAIVVTVWEFRLSRKLAATHPSAHVELRFDKVGSWPCWTMARARHAFRSPTVSALPPELLRSVRRYVIAEVVYIWVFAAVFCAFAFRWL
jgi:hypothetical protein